MTFVRRRIDLVFRLGQGSFGESGTDTVTVSGLRTQVQIEKVAGPGLGAAQIRVYGLTPTLLAQLSALNRATMAERNNLVTVLAGDDVSGMSVAFQGQMKVGQQCLNTAPESSLFVIAQAGGLATVQVTPVVSYPGTSDVAIMLQNIAAVAGWDFENSGVTMQLSTQYLHGDVMRQIRTLAEAGEGVFEYTIDQASKDKKQTLAIWPTGKARGSLIPLISPATGMVGYPNYSTSRIGLDIETIFNPQLLVGGMVQIQVDPSCPLTVANGQWQVFNIQHELDSETPGGKWFTRFTASSVEKVSQ